MKNKCVGFLKDSKGNFSSKRLAGLSLVTTGALMKIVLFIYSLALKVVIDGYIKLDDTADNLVYTGCFLLGWGVTEGAGKGIVKIIDKFKK